mmetsp:Transcript_8160/g.10565  ORF Transcript_8160/g.10565 Transcript_8160/m.10565 type:complete len:816 (-) Transcript_8160:140-2587(-)
MLLSKRMIGAQWFDQSQVMKHNVSMITRRSGGTMVNGLPDNILQRSHHDMRHIDLIGLDESVNFKGSFCPGVRVGNSSSGTPSLKDTQATRKTAQSNLNYFERKLTTPITQPPLPPAAPETKENSKETMLLKSKFIKDTTFSPAFRRTCLVALKRAGATVESPYSSVVLDKAPSDEEEGGEEEGGFTNLEIRSVVRFIEDCCDEQKRNGRIDFLELETVFRRAQRARAAAKFEGPGKKALLKLESLLRCRGQELDEWFAEVDVIHKDGLLTHEELKNALMKLKDPKQEAFNPYSLLAVDRDSEKEEITLAWMNYNRLHQQYPSAATDFYNLDAAQIKAVRLAEHAAEKARIAEDRRKLAAQRRSLMETEFASATLFPVHPDLDPNAATRIEEDKARVEKEFEDAEEEASRTRKQAILASANAFKVTRGSYDDASCPSISASVSLDSLCSARDSVHSEEHGENEVAAEKSENEVKQEQQEGSGIEGMLWKVLSDDVSVGHQACIDESNAAQEKAELARQDHVAMKVAKALQENDPHAYVENVQLAFETLTEPHKMNNYKKFGHPHGILKETVHPFTLQEVNNLIKYTDPNMDGKLSKHEIEQGLIRAHTAQVELFKEQKVGEILMKLEGRFHEDKVWGRVRELFDHLDADKSGEITVKELRKGLQNWNQKSAQERFREKKKEEIKKAMAAKKADKAASEDRLKKRLEEAEKSGAMVVLVKLEQMLKAKVMRTVDLFNKLDADGDGDIDIDEFMEGLAVNGELDLTRYETRLLIDFFDENGDGTIEAQEFDIVIRRLRMDKKKAKQMIKERKKLSSR